MSRLRVIAVTLPEFIGGEAETIASLLESGAVERVHLRKPGAEPGSMRRLIESIPPHLHQRLSLHDCHPLAADYGCGVHLNSRSPEAPAGFGGTVSRSCHSPAELLRPGMFDYQFLSPIYPSISKPGYEPAFTVDDLRGAVGPTTVALGGVTPSKFIELAAAGFGGAAMLGCIWQAARAGKLNELIHQIKCCNT